MATKKETPGKTSLKVGDLVMVIAGGHKVKRPNKGQVGRILRFIGKDKQRAVVEGLNMFTRHQRALGPDKPAGKVQREGSIHVSNLLFYVEKLKRPVRLKSKALTDGRKVRGYLDGTSKEFVQIDA